MRSQTTAQFRALLSEAPQAIQAKARAAYRLWSESPSHPSLRFKKVHDTLPVYSVRIDLGWRAVGVLQGDVQILRVVRSQSRIPRGRKRRAPGIGLESRLQVGAAHAGAAPGGRG